MRRPVSEGGRAESVVNALSGSGEGGVNIGRSGEVGTGIAGQARREMARKEAGGRVRRIRGI